VRRILDHLLHHGLHDGDIAIQRAAHKAGQKSNPVSLRKAKGKTAQCNACQANQRHRLPAINIGNGAPAQRSNGFCDSIGREQ
jgi:hypothetical protein